MNEYPLCKRGHVRSPDNLYGDGSCKQCKKEYAAKNYLLDPKKFLNRGKKWVKNNPDKVKKINDRYTSNNPDRVKASQKKHASKDSTKQKKNLFLKMNPHIRNKYRSNYVSKNREKINELNRNWAKNNPDKMLANTRKREFAKLQRVPKWLTKEQIGEIKSFYTLSKELYELTGIKHNVDHIVPLRGKTVSGLHVPWNLQVLTAEDNCRKRNRLIL